MVKNFVTRDIVNAVNYINEMDREKVKNLPTKIRWNLKKNMDKFISIANNFEDFQNELIRELQNEWFTEEKSIEEEQVRTDEDGQEIKQTIRKIKDEYRSEFDKAVKDINDKLNEILMENVEIDISPINIDKFVEEMEDDCSITFDDLTVLDIFSE